LKEDQKKDWLKKCNDLLMPISSVGQDVLYRFGTMKELAKSLHMPETKMQSEQCAKKGQMGPVKAKNHLYKINRPALDSFDLQDVICTNLVPKETMANVTCISGQRWTDW
jgi:hypothetical protein